MLWRFYVYLATIEPNRVEVLFKLNGAKLSERSIEVFMYGRGGKKEKGIGDFVVAGYKVFSYYIVVGKEARVRA